MSRSPKVRNRKPINLALQGGGAHGAFTWGVLDRILEDGRLDIEAISGTSAGAMNAVVMADGLMRSGPDGAREALEHFWSEIARASRLSPAKRTPFDVFMGNWTLDNSPGYQALEYMTGVASPYQLNPLNINPLLGLLRSTVDFDVVRQCNKVKLFVSATNVETGRVRVFSTDELTADAVMASACLPTLFHAVEIDGVPYWDGGFMGNPSLFPFHNSTNCRDIVIVQINPMERKGTPKTAHAIMNRQNEISFNASLMKELRTMEFVSRLIGNGVLSGEHYKDNRLHIIREDDALKPLGASSKMNAEWAFLTHLRDVGRTSAANWLDACYDRIGERSTVDIAEYF